MTTCIRRSALVLAVAVLSLAVQRHSFAGSATWGINPSSGDWNTAANWIPNTVPNGPSDIATFETSNVTDLSINTTVELDSIVFNRGANPFMITSGEGTNLTLAGTGIVNNSGVLQSLIKIPNGAIFFKNNATAGQMTSFSGVFFFFNDSSSAGSASFDATSDGIFQASIDFFDTTTAADATITANQGAQITVSDFASGGNAVFTVTTGAFVSFSLNATADRAVMTCIGGSIFSGSNIHFFEVTSAGEGHFTAVGASTSGEVGSDISFFSSATAANGTFIIDGGAGENLAGASLLFKDSSTAANATITANGGVGGSDGGAIIFQNRANGGKASISLLGNGKLDISESHSTQGVRIGSLAGDGLVFLGLNTLSVGSNNQSTIFSGVIQNGGTGGSLIKVGRGTLTLTGANTYSGTTTISAGVLQVSNSFGSGTGTGPVQVSAGTLAGTGIVAGPVTTGTGSGAGAFVAPSAGTTVPAALTIQSKLTFKADATYTYKVNTRNATGDQVTANGAAINSGAQFSFVPVANKRLMVGTVFTVINNSSGFPISGVFANLPNNSTLTVGHNTYQVSYSGGDGNDLTLTVVP